MEILKKLISEYQKYKKVISASQVVFLAAAIILFMLGYEAVARWLLAVFFVTFIFFVFVDIALYRKKSSPKVHKSFSEKFKEQTKTLFFILLVALSLRAFFVEAFKIPSGSMIPNLKIGDHLFVNKFIYGIRLPFTLVKLIDFTEPERGEIVIFNYPLDPSKDFIKRLIAKAGDEVEIIDDEVYVNGKKLERREASSDNYKLLDDIPNGENYSLHKEKSADGIEYIVMYRKDRFYGFSQCAYCKLTVEPDTYFVMGDNRDNSSDSRVWGLVPKAYVKGRSIFTWLSLDSEEKFLGIFPSIRWERFGRNIH